MSHPSQCERCGEPAAPSETATRVFCGPCASLASTGARASSELLFTVPAPVERAAELASLARPRDERPSFGSLLAFTGTPVIAPPRSRARLASSLFAASAILFAGSTAALAWHVARLAPPPSAAPEPKTSAASAKAELAPRRARADETPAPMVVAPSPAPELAPRAEAAAPRPVDPRPSSRAPRTPRAPRAAAPAPSTEGDLFDDLFESPSAPAAAPAIAQRVPTRRDVTLAMRALEDEVAMCAEGAYGMVTTRVTFTGPSGRVAHAEVVDTTVPSAVRSCIARAVRAAELPAFAQERFTVAYPFRL